MHHSNYISQKCYSFLMCKTFLMRKTLLSAPLTFAVLESQRGELKIMRITQSGEKERESIPFSFVVMTERPTKWEMKGADGSQHTCTVTELHRGGDTCRARQLTLRECEMRKGNKTPDKVQNCGDKLRNLNSKRASDHNREEPLLKVGYISLRPKRTFITWIVYGKNWKGWQIYTMARYETNG